MDDKCIFCKIIGGIIPSYKAYEDAEVFAFLDIHPINPGHLLVVPKQHVPDFYNLEDDLYQKVMLVAKKLANVVNTVTKPQKVGMLIAGFEVPHTHIHVIPLNDFHDFTKAQPENREPGPSPTELAEMTTRITNGLAIS